MTTAGLRAWLFAVTWVAVLAPRDAVACSGPGAAASIETATIVGWASFALSVALAAAMLAVVLQTRRSRTAAVAVVGVLLTMTLAHPGLWASATSGDCGAWRLVLSVTVAALEAVAVGLVLPFYLRNQVRP